VRPEGLGKVEKKLIRLIGSRTRVLLACSTVPEPLILLEAAEIYAPLFVALCSTRRSVESEHRTQQDVPSLLYRLVASGAISGLFRDTCTPHAPAIRGSV
jgi:hypothetical protein